VPLVVHGGTGLPPEYVERLIAMGGSKFNVSTELKYTLLDTTHDYLQAHRGEYDPGKLDGAVRDATRKVVIHWMEMLKSPGKA
jgi:fructose/tagatose bisphosphate aldolase